MTFAIRILFAVSVLPWPLVRNGGAQRTALLLEGLRRIGEVDVVFVDFDQATTGGLDPDFFSTAGIPILDAGSRSHRQAPNSRLARALYEYQERYRPAAKEGFAELLRRKPYDLVVFRYARTAMACGGGQIDRPVIIDIDDVDWHVPMNATAFTRTARSSIRARLGSYQIRFLLRPLIRKASRLLVCSDADRVEFPAGKATVVPNVPFRLPDEPAHPLLDPADSSSTILIVGSLGYYPHKVSIQDFIDNCWPGIRQAVPGATLRLVGKIDDPETESAWAATPGVSIAGFVDDLQAEYAQCAFTVAPIKMGAGTKIKVLESLAFGRTCIATRHAAHGFDGYLKSGHDLLVAEDNAAMVRDCVSLLHDPQRRNALARSGNAAIRAHFTAEAFVEKVAQTCREVLEAQRNPQNR
jgi:glycosyltransferase involved in cell wall biosynthesis